MIITVYHADEYRTKHWPVFVRKKLCSGFCVICYVGSWLWQGGNKEAYHVRVNRGECFYWTLNRKWDHVDTLGLVKLTVLPSSPLCESLFYLKLPALWLILYSSVD